MGCACGPARGSRQTLFQGPVIGPGRCALSALLLRRLLRVPGAALLRLIGLVLRLACLCLACLRLACLRLAGRARLVRLRGPLRAVLLRVLTSRFLVDVLGHDEILSGSGSGHEGLNCVL